MYNYFLVLSAASVGTGQPFLSQDCSKSGFLELLCMHCKAFMGVLRLFNELVASPCGMCVCLCACVCV